MTTRAATANGLSKAEETLLELIDRRLAEIKVIEADIARKRAGGRRTSARIDRNLNEIQDIIDRVEATL
jgi:hypothetical protein